MAERDGMKFHSKREANFYDQAKLMQHAGVIYFFLRQVPFHLPGNVTYRVDFQLFYSDGTVRFVDVKGFKTSQYIEKKKMVETIYPVTIEEV